MKRNRYNRNRSLEKKLAAYGAAAAATLFAGADAHAQDCNAVAGTTRTMVGTFCYSDVDPDVVLNTGGATFQIDFDGDGTAEFRARMYNTGFIIPQLDRLPAGGGTGHNMSGGYVEAMSSGASVTSGQMSTGGANNKFLANTGAGPWINATSQFAGVRATLGSNMHLGWVRMSVNADGSQITVEEYAYNTQATTPIPTGYGNLPVELTSLDVVASGPGVHVRWQTVSETNNAGFEIQMRRAAERDFAPVDFVEGHGTTNVPQRYRHRLEALEPGRYSFRLKQVDFDGQFAYSAEVEATVEVPGTHVLSEVYPNPFNPQAQFTLAVKQAQQVHVAVYDALGRQVALLHEGTLAAGEAHRFTFDASDLPSGSYLVRAVGEDFVSTQPATLVK